MEALIDGDIIVHRVGYTTEDTNPAIAKFRTDEMLDRILSTTKADHFRLFLSDTTENNYRSRIYREYKANRVQSKPKHYNLIKEHLITEWGAEICLEQEADDGLGIAQHRDSIICSIDKDLLQIPGRHYNFVEEKEFFVSRYDGLRYFYSQLIQGDSGDNVPGVWRAGKAKAAKVLEGLESEIEMFSATVETYKEWLLKEWGKEWDEFKEKQMLGMILIYGRVLKIRQKEGEIWNFPNGTEHKQPLLEDLESLSILPKPVVIDQSTEPMIQEIQN